MYVEVDMHLVNGCVIYNPELFMMFNKYVFDFSNQALLFYSLHKCTENL